MRKVWLWLAGVFVLLLIAVVGIAFFIDEPLRGYVERTMNEHLQGYTIRIGALDVHPFRLSVDVKDFSISQDANPDPPIVHIPRLSAGVQWRELLSAHVVGDVLVERPTVHINLKQVRSEAADEVPIEKRGWQEAIEAVLPFKINKLQIIDGDLTYIDEGPFRPLHITQLQVRAENIRNIRSPEHVYPSDLHLEGTVFDTGKISLDGRANFLAEPHLGVQGQLTLEQIDLDYFKPITNRYNMAVRGADSRLHAPLNMPRAPR